MRETQLLTTTLNRLKTARACSDKYAHLLRALGGTSFDHDAPINLLTILEHNGIDDCLWALRATVEDCDRVARLMAADFAEAVLPIFEREYPDDGRPRAAIAAARLYARGEIGAAALAAALAAAGDAVAAAWDAGAAAGAAAWDAAWAAGAAARAAGAAARDAGAAAGAAAWDAAWAAGAAAGNEQAIIIRRYLLPEAGK
jgi:hypothetical protein